jgi:hypothetical protein
MRQSLINKKIHELVDLCLEISEGKKYNAWIAYSGHVNLIDVRVATKDDYTNVIYDVSIYRDRLFDKNKLVDALTRLDEYLKESEKEEMKAEMINEATE